MTFGGDADSIFIIHRICIILPIESMADRNVMKRISKIAAILAVAAISTGALALPKVIYGDDNRRDVYAELRADVRKVADSTVAMIANALLEEQGDKVILYPQFFGPGFSLCKEEPFYSQPSAAECSGFLVGDDMVATAGHCINKSICQFKSFVFNYRMLNNDRAPKELPVDDVYSCKEVVSREQNDQNDYAIVRLDRPVRGHRVLTMQKESVNVMDEVLVIGHPSGLPTKIADDAYVRRAEENFFMANLDTYGGSSGSAVFNAKTLAVVGILARGVDDFTWDSTRGCKISNRCSNEGCNGEQIMNIKSLSEALARISN